MPYEQEHTREWYTRREFFRSEVPRIETLYRRGDPVPGETGEHEL